MRITSDTKINPIVSFTAENFISNEAINNQATTCSLYVSIHNNYYVTDKTIYPTEIENIFNVENLPFTLDSVCDKLRELRDLDLVYPVEYIDTFLTDIVNIYLEKIIGSNISIESAFLDFESLLEYLGNDTKYKMSLDKLAFKIMSTLELNHSKIKMLMNAIEDNKTITNNNENFYIIPILYCEAIVFIKAGNDLGYKEYLKLRDSFNSIATRNYEVPKNSLIHDFLVDLENSSEYFKNSGYIRCCYYTTRNIKGYETFIVYKNANDKFVVQF